MGPRHDPLVASFMNGTVKGDKVFIPMSKIIGGQARCGFGWNMLMDCLAEGRSVSLPASAVGGAKLVHIYTYILTMLLYHYYYFFSCIHCISP